MKTVRCINIRDEMREKFVKIEHSVYVSLAAILLISCAAPQRIATPVRIIQQSQVQTKRTPPDFRPLSEKFFLQCENDISNSSLEISRRELISTLSHLNRMNSGGRRYYLLEKENITGMLNQLSSYQYSECYIINSKGIIIYTMKNDELLGKPVRAASTQVQTAFKKGINGEQSVEDVDTESLAPASYDLYFGMPVAENGVLCGVLISTVSIEHLARQLPSAACILSSEGEYRYKNMRQIVDIAELHYSEKRAQIEQTAPSVLASDGLSYMPFEYKTIHWCIVSPY